MYLFKQKEYQIF